ncbi:glucose-1-phosphate adenylyltransferase [Corynebacterium sp. 153RC1]|uniref:glucose-1-phosphate adenylyltransferase n=1 Tax=Corynebacterium TaxID=1716 RepID=UPI00211C0EF8|nr:glucose-1-phosphate adenylyltransferase [Corynebacterium sp. 76QC2CO]MCQ9351971.1 glucose-1-phosphate adenylyltransferase [Corynebacterium sp. 209RC1]MCQ9353720.1 glucose-1-phosphate adenylyltransferase [Corynebacterium sp. 1222RC1]MCQ9356296.1 glucose-1-phosphate adenylyltransferase [Corynebacterium sp. 122RC1]MCQ9358398.1 glucose-1-phosphate adenylyltransferase [Corynebacterium sp. 142RC1]MCQ9360867.1 glucose-1-phosphate adenylyltransferase [Corynebacterium sp. 153RC1]MCQ9362801.1 glucos
MGGVRNQYNALAIVLAGGEGKRLFPLTEDRAKPAVPFGGNYRLIDFVLSNLVNAGYLKICVLTQYKSHSLDRHISQAWQFSGPTSQYIASVPAQQRLGKRWYQGSADAILQSLNLIYDEQPDYVLVFGADHVYRMDPEQMVEEHIASGKSVSVAGIRVPRSEASAFGCIQSDEHGNITEFLEKPADPPGTPDDPEVTYASMGNYVFTAKALVDALKEDENNPDSTHDMGGDIIPYFVKRGDAHVYDFSNNEVPGSTDRDRGYWRDVGTIDAFYEAHMDLISVHPVFNLYNRKWAIHSTDGGELPPAKFVQGGIAQSSMVAQGSIISGATVRNSVLSTGVIVEEGATVEGSVLMPGVRIGKGAVVRHCILDKNVVVNDGTLIGVDRDRDAQRFAISPGGVVVVGKNQTV